MNFVLIDKNNDNIIIIMGIMAYYATKDINGEIVFFLGSLAVNATNMIRKERKQAQLSLVEMGYMMIVAIFNDDKDIIVNLYRSN